MTNVLIADVAHLDRAAVERVAHGGARLELAPALLDRVERGRGAMLAHLAEHPDGVYGVSTGMGHLAGVALSAADQVDHQRDLLLGRAVGSAPWLPPAEARALMMARLVNLLSGHAGASAALCAFLCDRLNDGFVPAVPRRGGGSAGEVIPLAHAFQTLLGVGLVLDPDGTPRDAAGALRARGVAPYAPRAKEGVALLAGAPTAVALALGRHRAAEALASVLLVAAAAATDALGAPRSPYGAAAGRLAGDPRLQATLGRFRALVGEPDGVEDARRRQAPVSFRVGPTAIAQLERVLARLGRDLDRALAAVTDSPAFVDGGFVSTAGFHALGLASGLDALALALAQAGELCAQRVHRLLDGRFSGLADQLTPAPGPRCGLVVVHKRMLGAVNELRHLATPVALGIGDTSLGQEDAMTFVPEGAERLRRAEALVRELAGCELLVARQAWWLRGAAPAPGLRAVAAALAGAVPPVDEDRPLGPDIDRVIALVGAGALG